MDHPIGSLAWGRLGKGRLSRTEMLAFVAQAASHQVRELVRHMSPAYRRRLGVLDELDWSLPDSAVAERAQSLCAELSPPYLLNHCYRTYFWGMALGKVDDFLFDRETLFVAAMLHDLGHTEPYKTDGAQRCFAVSGAEAAHAILREAGWGASRCQCVANAIALHMNVAPTPMDQGSEARLLQAGAAFDVVGSRYREVAAPSVEKVVERYPRLGFKCAFARLMHEEGRRQPGTRVQIIDGLMGLRGRIMRAPFAQ